jgi:hypothetical protein
LIEPCPGKRRPLAVPWSWYMATESTETISDYSGTSEQGDSVANVDVDRLVTS